MAMSTYITNVYGIMYLTLAGPEFCDVLGEVILRLSHALIPVLPSNPFKCGVLAEAIGVQDTNRLHHSLPLACRWKNAPDLFLVEM